MPHCLTVAMAWRPPGRWWIRFSKPGPVRNLSFRIIRQEPGARRKPTHCWSEMDDIGANPNQPPREALPGVWVCSNANELAHAAARRFVDWAWQSIARDGH